MHHLATVDARDNQPTNDVTTRDYIGRTVYIISGHDTAYLNKRLFY